MKGIRCMIELKVQNRAAEIRIIPTSSALLIQELKVKRKYKTKSSEHIDQFEMDNGKKLIIEKKAFIYNSTRENRFRPLF